MATEKTGNFGFEIPVGNTAPWLEVWRRNWETVDATMAMLFTISNFQGAWDNSTEYDVDDVVVDTDSGVLFKAAVAHTSPGGAITFISDRIANDTQWTAYASTVGFRGIWTTVTQYEKGDAVVSNDTLAIAATGHTSTATFANDVAAGKWTILIDFNSVQAASEAALAAALAAAATIPTPTVALSMIRINAGMTAYERRTAAEVRADIGADNAGNLTSGTLALDRGGTGQITAALAFAALKQAASETATGVAELATQAEVNTGADDARIITPLKLKAWVPGVDTVTLAATDFLLLSDVSDSNLLKKALVSDIATGKVRQIVFAVKTDTTSIASATFADIAGITLSLTPVSATNRVLVIFSGMAGHSGGDFVWFKFVRDATDLTKGDAAGSRIRVNGAAFPGAPASFDQFIGFANDLPGDVSAHTYKVQWAAVTGTGYLNRSGTDTDAAGYGRGSAMLIAIEYTP